MKIGAIEGGGTKFICAVGNELGIIENEIIIATTTPLETLNKVIQFFKDNPVEKIGIGCFGPLELDEEKENYGSILQSPKIEWSNFNIVKYLNNALNIPIKITTDVNAAALAEIEVGNSKNLNSVLYITIGTGIGVGAIINRKFLSGINHPEMGHIRLKKHDSDIFNGECPFHGDCFEGLASGIAIEKRFNKKGEELLDKKDVWDLIGYYIGQAIASLNFILAPQRVIIGGGVGINPLLLEYTKNYFKEFNNNYISNEYTNDLNSFIQITSLNNRAGLIGALILTQINN